MSWRERKMSEHDKWNHSLLKFSVIIYKSNSILDWKYGLYSRKLIPHGCRCFLNCTTVFLDLFQNKKVSKSSNVTPWPKEIKILSKRKLTFYMFASFFLNISSSCFFLQMKCHPTDPNFISGELNYSGQMKCNLSIPISTS